MTGLKADLAGKEADVLGRARRARLVHARMRALLSQSFSSSTLLQGAALVQGEAGMMLHEDDSDLQTELQQLQVSMIAVKHDDCQAMREKLLQEQELKPSEP